jgi:hypothetical protein
VRGTTRGRLAVDASRTRWHSLFDSFDLAARDPTVSVRHDTLRLRGVPPSASTKDGNTKVQETSTDASDAAPLPPSLVRSKKRVSDHGEVFTPSWLVDDMLDLVKGETERIDSRFLEPACGSGNFLVQVLIRKLAAVERRYGKSDFEKRHQALHALMCTYGIELLDDNIAECREKMMIPFSEYLGLRESDDLYRAALYVLSVNIVHADALTMRTPSGAPIAFAEWSYLGRGRYQRRDFRFESMTQRAAFSVEDGLFADAGKHEIFTPLSVYKPTTIKELAQ